MGGRKTSFIYLHTRVSSNGLDLTHRVWSKHGSCHLFSRFVLIGADRAHTCPTRRANGRAARAGCGL